MFVILFGVVAALLAIAVPKTRYLSSLWLLIVSTGGPWLVWDFARKLYTAAMEGYFDTDLYGRAHRDSERSLFRNNVIAHIALLPVFTSGVVLIWLNALDAVQMAQ
ncbi:hypothetical protein HMF7854_10310 [Sphingomonas ginkgonis]|uniref:Uncharacterized protein n=1 Tax=Sphingomonas ginkgonis TaxID=2315330 RepID=A0A3R9Y6G1_9SPHN|nr:hypothetical protein [Sphingomonas ginkgonis]RST31185.1 hypothetical protein HMF7854_10310 [Sphingomonas ginkgonis]